MNAVESAEILKSLENETESENTKNAIIFAVNSMARDIELKPDSVHWSGDCDSFVAYCPSCMASVMSEHFFCPRCGQALNWIDADDLEME